MRGYSEFPDKEEMMRNMKRKKNIIQSKPSSAVQTFLDALKNDLSISSENKKTIRSLLESAINHEGAREDLTNKKDEEKEDEGEENFSEVARSMGRDTIDMLSNATMR